MAWAGEDKAARVVRPVDFCENPFALGLQRLLLYKLSTSELLEAASMSTAAPSTAHCLDSFLTIFELAWPHMCAWARRDVRATCRIARACNDRRLDHLKLSFDCVVVPMPTVAEASATLSSLAQRGCKGLQALTVTACGCEGHVPPKELT